MTNNCCNLNTKDSTWISTAFINNRGLPTIFNEPIKDYLTNNTPAVQVFVRIAPSTNNPSKLVYWLNGKESPRLVLTRGKKYAFNVVSHGYPFYFTTDNIGGNGNKNNISQLLPSDYFSNTFTMTDDIPNTFYYQCSTHPNIGGQVVITN